MISIDATIGYEAPLRRVHETIGDEVVGLRGPNGSGKTTLLRTLAGVHRVIAGTIEVDGVVVDDGTSFVVPERRGIRYVDRDAFPSGDVLDFLAFPERCRGESRRLAHALALKAIEEFGLQDLRGLSVAAMSHGQLGRATLARAFVGSPRAILLDEPMRGIDDAHREVLLPIVSSALRTVRSAIVVSHDDRDFDALCDRVVDFDGR